MRSSTAFLAFLLGLAVPAQAQTTIPTSLVWIQPLIEPLEPATNGIVSRRIELAGEPAASILAQEPEGSVGESVALGLLFGAAGFFGGGWAAAQLADCEAGHELCGLEEAFFGAAAFGTAGLALGVHLGNARQGNYALDLVTAAGVWAVGYSLASADGFDSSLSTASFVLTPVMQLIATISVEQATGRARRSRHENTVSLIASPDGRGGLVLATSVRF